jgi:DNA-binding MarR family transcriptional regulator
MKKKNDIDLENWALLLRTYNKTIRSIKKDLKDKDHWPIEWYDILWAIERGEDQQLRMQEIGEKVDLEKYNVSRIVDKLVEEKLVTKINCDDDKRGAYAAITEKGLKVRSKMWETYRDSIQDHFGKKFTPDQGQQLFKILSSFLNKIS